MDVDAINFGKFRANYAQVGADAPAQALANAYNMGTPFGSQISHLLQIRMQMQACFQRVRILQRLD